MTDTRHLMQAEIHRILSSPLSDETMKRIRERVTKEGRVEADVLRIVREETHDEKFRVDKERIERTALMVLFFAVIITWASGLAGNQKQTEPPALAEMLLTAVVKGKYRDALIGDLNEKFQCWINQGYSIARARRLYWSEALEALGPLIWTKLKRVGVISVVAVAAKRIFLG